MINPRNLAVFEGHLCSDPKFFSTKDGKEFAAVFNIGVGRNFKNREGEYKSDFIPLRYQGKMEFAHRLKKGDLVRVVCSYRTGEPYEKNGEKVYPDGYFLVESLSYTPKNKSGNTAPTAPTDTASAHTVDTAEAAMPDDFDDIDMEGLPFD